MSSLRAICDEMEWKVLRDSRNVDISRANMSLAGVLKTVPQLRLNAEHDMWSITDTVQAPQRRKMYRPVL